MAAMSSRLVGGFCLGSDVGAGLGEILPFGPGAGSAASAGMTEVARVGVTDGEWVCEKREWGATVVLFTSRYPRQARV